jgi:ATP-dependent helicase HrpA
VRLLLPSNPPPAHLEAVTDVREQLNRLLPVGFVTTTGAAHLGDLARYLTASKRRLEKLPQALQGDRERMRRVHAVQEEFDYLVQTLPATRATASDIRDIGRQIEELRVSLWAQQLGTPRPVSEQRIYRAIDAARERS